MEKSVIIKDPTDKLYKIGYADGKTRAIKVIQSNPKNLELLNPQGPQRYLEGYKDGILAAKSMYEEPLEEKSSKAR